MGWAFSLGRRSLVDLGLAVFSVELLLVDGILNTLLLFLFEDLLVFKELFLRSCLAVLLLVELRRKRAVLQLGVNDTFALLLDAGQAALLPLLKSAVVVLLIFKFAL